MITTGPPGSTFLCDIHGHSYVNHCHGASSKWLTEDSASRYGGYMRICRISSRRQPIGGWSYSFGIGSRANIPSQLKNDFVAIPKSKPLKSMGGSPGELSEELVT